MGQMHARKMNAQLRGREIFSDDVSARWSFSAHVKKYIRRR